MEHMKVLVNRAIDHGEYQDLARDLARRLWATANNYDTAQGGLPTLDDIGLQCTDFDGHLASHYLAVPNKDAMQKLVFAMLEDVDPVFNAPADMHYVWTVTSDDEPGVCYVADTQHSARRYVEKLVLNQEPAPEPGEVVWQHLGDDMLRLGIYLVHRCVVSYGIF